MVIVDSDMVVQQVSPAQMWRLILSLVSVCSSPMYDMSVCHLLTSTTAVIKDIMLIPICTSGKDVDILATYTLNRRSGTVGLIKLV